MLEALALALAVYTAARTATHAWRRQNRQAITVAVAGMALIALLLTPYARRRHLENRAASAAGELVGLDVDVSCVTLLGEFTNEHYTHAGWVNWDENGDTEQRTVLSYETCQGLRHYLADPGTDNLDAMYAVHTLAHEARHMAGTTNEAETECETHQRTAAMARLLGANDTQARKLAVTVWTETYPHMPEGYTSSECRDGGALDENLPEAPWDLTATAAQAEE